MSFARVLLVILTVATISIVFIKSWIEIGGGRIGE